MSSESIASATSPASATETCASCGAPLAGDQRYCLECGERRLTPSSVLASGPPPSGPPAAAAAPPAPPLASNDAPPRGSAVTLIAGVGVLLLAMGVGVLIGRSGGSSKPTAAATPQVISVGTAPSGTGASGSEAPAAFTDDWPTATNGYTVQLQTLPQASTQASAVQAAKAAAEGKGAKNVGALKSEDFSSLTAGSYVVYSGVFHKKPEATKALGALKKSFPKATVITVSSAGGAKSGASPGATSGGGAGAGSSPSNPAPPKVLEELHKTKGKSYEEKSKNLPNVVGT